MSKFLKHIKSLTNFARMKAFTLILIILTFFNISCNHLTGDNKPASIDTPKAELASMSIRTDVPPVFTNNFKGKIQFIEKNLFDTILYNLFVNNNLVRIDKFEKKENNESIIINLITKQMFVLNHKKKLYSKFQINEEKVEYDSNYKIIKTENEKDVIGYKCKQWRVKNAKENTEITYWVNNQNYGFYYYFIKTWNNTSKINKYFQLIPNSFGYMPLEITERNLLRDIKTSIIFTKLENSTIDTSVFKIPKEYTLFAI
jgi:hypothetical protein